MSKLEELIEQYCPDGVEYYKIKDVYKRIKGTPITAGKMKEIATPDGSVRIFAGGKTVIDANEKDIPNANITRVPAVLIQSRGVIDAVYYDKPFTFKNEMWAYTTFNQKSVKYLYYILKSNIQTFRDAASGMGALPQISLGVTEEFEIPVPPLPVQEEIVRILDTFTELQAELQAELQKRKQQYNYYRDNLLTNFTTEQNVKEYTLGELGTFTRGNGLQKKDFTKEGIGCIHYGQIYTRFGAFADKTLTYVNRELASHLLQVEKGNLVIACTSENVEDICKSVAWLGEENICTGGHACVFRHNQNPKYISYFFQTEYFFNQKKKYTYGTKVKDIKPDSIAKIKIPLPSLKEQERIVSILDNLYTLTTDLTQGLPAEIEKRRQQYEYYRDKLLTLQKKRSITKHEKHNNGTIQYHS